MQKKFNTQVIQSQSTTTGTDQDDEVEVCESVNTSLKAVGVFPLKFQRIKKKDVLKYTKRKTSQVQTVIAKKVALVGGISYDSIMEPSASKQCENCLSYNQVLDELKQKFKISNRSEKLQILTLAPAHWTINTTMAEFDASERMVKNARMLKTAQGILAVPGKKQGMRIPVHVKEKVISFY